ncbi:hypothetical protein [Arachidicoccus sp.]|uniref:hypothetical protein n=1 Tax=Arachidicoccus sp. TaxID=1872624 RepID=UPI003D249C72
MKKGIFLFCVFLLLSANIFSQSYCFAYTSDDRGAYSTNNVLYVSKVFDGDDFTGGKDNMDNIKWSIKESLKDVGKKLFGSQSYQYKFSFIATNKDGYRFVNAYQAGEERKKIITQYKNKGYKVIEFKVEPQ